MRLRGTKQGLWHIGAFALGFASLLALQQTANAFSVRCDRLFEDVGPVIRLKLPGTDRDPRGMRVRRLRVGHYSLNRFNLAHGPGMPSGQQDQTAVVAAIEFERPDVLTLSEVVNRGSLNELSRRLRGVYEPIMIDGNGDLSMAVLVRKTLPFLTEVESHRSIRHEYMGVSEPLFTRDLLVIHLSLPGSEKALLSIAAGHFKAQKDNFPRDPQFKIKRTAEEAGALEILDNSARLRLSRARILLGDVNSDARRFNEMRAFKAAGYRDSLDVLGIPMERRTTHSHFPKEGTPEFWQTDVAFVSPELVARDALVSGYVAADRTEFGRALPRPRNIEELRRRPSDHQMVIIEIDVTKMN